jgi:hypothetical protein
MVNLRGLDSLLHRVMPGRRKVPDTLAGGDKNHLQSALRSDNRATQLIGRGLLLFGSLLNSAPRPWTLTGSNDLSAVACFARAFRQFRAATLLAHMGYYSEVTTVLRSGYESASVGRYLAREPQKADKWIEKKTSHPNNTDGWIPDREVRSWFGDTDEKAYAAIYGVLSKGAHPSAAACFPLLSFHEKGYSIKFDSVFESEAFQDSLFEVLGVLLWSCFALRNAAPDEKLLPPGWRQALAEYAGDVGTLLRERTGKAPDFAHLQRDWEGEYEQWEQFLDRVHKAEATEELLKNDPRSWRNLRND